MGRNPSGRILCSREMYGGGDIIQSCYWPSFWGERWRTCAYALVGHGCFDAEERLVMTKTLTKACQGNTQRSPNLLQIFGTQSQSSQAGKDTATQAAITTVGHDTQPDKQATAVTTGHEPQPHEVTPTRTGSTASLSPPAPKKLRFSTTPPAGARPNDLKSTGPPASSPDSEGAASAESAEEEPQSTTP